MSTTEQAPAAPIETPDVEPMPVAVKFISRGRHLTLERVHPRRQVDASGNAVWTTGLSYEFQDVGGLHGELVIYPAQDVIADKFDPDTGQMHEQDALEWLRSQPLYGVGHGFWEAAPVAPDPAPLMQKIMQLAVQAGNPESREDAEQRLADIHEAEATSWKRPAVLDACTTALAAIDSHRELAEVEPTEPTGASERGLPAPPPPRPDAEAAPHTKPEGWNPSLEANFNPDAAPTREQ